MATPKGCRNINYSIGMKVGYQVIHFLKAILQLLGSVQSNWFQGQGNDSSEDERLQMDGSIDCVFPTLLTHPITGDSHFKAQPGPKPCVRVPHISKRARRTNAVALVD